MTEQIISNSAALATMNDWLPTPAGQYLVAWEQARFDAAVADLFGYHALQLGLPQIHSLRTNRIPHQWLAAAQSAAKPLASVGSAIALAADSTMLPFSANSLDLVTLPHTLELSVDPHATLAEVERVLVPEGRVVICGFNPTSLWGLRQRRAHLYRRFLGRGELFLPEAGEMIAYRRLRDWLRLLSFEVESSGFGCYRPALQTESLQKRFAWMDRAGERWWPIFGSVYFIVAAKRVRGMRLLEPNWKRRPKLVAAPVSIAPRANNTPVDGLFD
jgi:SAM-dependent methyltransferase